MKKSILVVGVVCILGVLMLISADNGKPDVWYERITSEGGDAAYHEFAESMQLVPLSKQHEKAHEFGADLYRALNIDGVAVCDAQFSYGCFHEFLGRAIAEHGLEVTNELLQKCGAKLGSSLACQHGLGHGILSNLGYSFDDLVTGLKTCDSLSTLTPGGCFGGVFMEHNMRVMLAGGDEIRPLTEDVFEPCSSLPARYRRACHYQLPQWWQEHLKHLTIYDGYKVMGERCATLSNDVRRSCFAGIGIETIPDAHDSMERATSLCASATLMQDRVWCLALASQGFPKEVRKEMCAPLSPADRTLCETYGEDQELVLALQGFAIGE